MPDTFRIAIAQLNPTVGALKANAELIVNTANSLQSEKVDFIVFPELFLSGYPIQDLVTKPAFVQECRLTVENLMEKLDLETAIGFGCPWFIEGKVYNCYVVIKKKKIVAVIQKHHLPFSEVFDEMRQFQSGPICGPIQINDVKIGIPICEDAWHEDVCETLLESGAEILIIPNGSPYSRNILEIRLNTMVARVIQTELPLVYLNLVGGQDDQVFDGGSFVLNPKGNLATQFPIFEEKIGFTQFKKVNEEWYANSDCLSLIPPTMEMDYQAIVTGVKDYIQKSGFSSVLIGLSGGIDSALVATIAVDVVGPENTHCIMLPSQFTSKESKKDASELAHKLGCNLMEIDIEPVFQETLKSLEPHFSNLQPDLSEENLQSRIRGLLLMGMSNKFGHLVLTTGNKSEISVGYSTIYGDMVGGYNPIKDLYKTRLFEMAQWRNENFRKWMRGPRETVIPPNIIKKPPTAELRPNQKDSDSLPPYEVLDQILEMLIDKDKSVKEVVEKGFNAQIVKSVEQLVYSSEYKRFQSAPGVRLSKRAFWLDRRYPIVNHWREKTE